MHSDVRTKVRIMGGRAGGWVGASTGGRAGGRSGGTAGIYNNVQINGGRQT